MGGIPCQPHLWTKIFSALRLAIAHRMAISGVVLIA
jgi:hypothetical protein